MYPGRTLLRSIAIAAALVMAWSPAAAQQLPAAVLSVGPTEDIERWRLATLVDSASDRGLFLRSTSSLSPRTDPGVSLLGGRIAMIHNSALPYGTNQGWLWAGRGINVSAGAAVALSGRRLRAILAPEIVHSANDFVARDTERFWAPDIPVDRSPYTLLWYSGPYSADVPIRFGDRPISKLTPGQSSVAIELGGAEFGVGTENLWWGPGFRNALVLSNNAPGFPHAFIRSTVPWASFLGTVEFRWIVGGLSESPFFDTTAANDLRSLSAAMVTLQPWRAPNLTVGFSRSVMGTATGWNEVPLRWFDVLRGVDRTNDFPLNDSTLYPGGREQILALFARLRLPRSGFETHFELGRTESPRSVRDFLLYPTHSRAYTLGLQWRSAPTADFWRVQTEMTTLEQGSSFRDRPLGVWYTSRRVIQGYTNRGETLGAGVGPGSSGQWLAIDRFTPLARYGIYGGRTRHNEDVRSIYPFPDYQAYCNRDVNMYWGARGSRETPAGRFSLDATFGNRIHLWFQVASGCPRGDAMLDVRNRTISFTFEPLARRAQRAAPR